MNKSESFEHYLQQEAYYGQGELKVSDLVSNLPGETELLGKGFFSRVYRLKNTPWVIKEGRWDLDLKVTSEVDIPMPSRLLQHIFRPLNYHFQPTEKEIIKQYHDYLLFADYFGMFDIGEYFHPRLEEIRTKQKIIRASLTDSITDIEKKYGISNLRALKEIFNSETIATNFLPKEYLLYGPSLTASQKSKNTSFIVQEFVQGKTLHDMSLTEMSSSHKRQLILFLYLILKFNFDTGLLPDMRPRYLITQVHDWFYSTDNVVLTPQGEVRYLDTRWLWPSSKRNLLRRGFVFPELIINSTKRWLYILTGEL